jgi:hypothetical protein
MKFVDASRIQELSGYADADLNGLIAGGRFCWATADSAPSVTNVKVRCSSCFGATLGG